MIKEGGGKANFDILFLHNKILNLVKNKACETLQSKIFSSFPSLGLTLPTNVGI